jgi:hypothetical protein
MPKDIHLARRIRGERSNWNIAKFIFDTDLIRMSRLESRLSSMVQYLYSGKELLHVS